MAATTPPVASVAEGEAPTDKRSDIDIQIEHHRKALLDLRLRRNALAPISVLLPEILSYIFHFCVDDSGTRESMFWANVDLPSIVSPGLSYGYARTALTLSHVCRQWRSIARDDALLWTHIFMSNVELCQRMLVRSKQAALTVRHGFISNDGKSLISLGHALAHLSRIKTLQISCQYYGTNLPRRFMEYISSPAPLLEELYLSNLTGHWATNALPDTVFAGCVPRLARLTVLHGAQLSWSSPLLKLSSLTHLHIGDMTEWKNSTLDPLLTVLARLPLLRGLALEQAIPAGPQVTGRTVALPALTHLTLSDDQSSCVALLQALTLPPSVSITLQSFLAGDQVDYQPALTHCLTHVAPFFAGMRTARIYVTKDGAVNQLRIQAWEGAVTDSAALGSMHAGRAVVDFMWSGQPVMDIQVVLDACAALALDGLDVFAGGILSYNNEHPQDWRPVFRRWPGVHTVHVGGTMLDVLVEALAQPLPPHPNPNPNPHPNLNPDAEPQPAHISDAHADDPPAPLFPHMHTLLIDRAMLHPDTARTLARVIAARAPTLRTVALLHCNVEAETVAELRAAAGAVAVPGERAAAGTGEDARTGEGAGESATARTGDGASASTAGAVTVTWDGKQNRSLQPLGLWSGSVMDDYETVDEDFVPQVMQAGEFAHEP